MSSFDLPAWGAFDETVVEALLTGRADAADPLATVIGALRRAGARRSPEPSPELAALFVAGLPAAEPRMRPVVKLCLAAAAVAATLTLSGVAAAHDALPDPAERVVSNLINTFSPFHIGEPQIRHGVPARPVPVPAATLPAGGGPSLPNGGARGPSVPATTAAESSAQSGPGPGSGSGKDGDGGDRSSGGDGNRSGNDGGSGSGSGTSGDGGSGDGSQSSSPTPSPSSSSTSGAGGGSGDGTGSDGPDGGGSSSSSTDGGSGSSDSGG